MHLAERAALDSKVLRVDVNCAAVNTAVAGHNAVAERFIAFGWVLLAGQAANFPEGTGIEQQVNAFAGGKTALGVLAVDACLPTTQF